MDWTVYCVPLCPAMLQCALTVPHNFPAEAAPPTGVNASAETATASSITKHAPRNLVPTVRGYYPPEDAAKPFGSDQGLSGQSRSYVSPSCRSVGRAGSLRPLRVASPLTSPASVVAWG
jgi:hypothetical protein